MVDELPEGIKVLSFFPLKANRSLLSAQAADVQKAKKEPVPFVDAKRYVHGGDVGACQSETALRDCERVSG